MAAATSLAGPNYSITAALGRQVGSNLFHSFSTFNLSAGQSATFSGPTGIGNVISRVTGANASNIDGTLRSTIPGANLFLINPKGILFGPNASLDLTGSFVASTANYIRLADGGRFDATTPAASVLTSAPPAAFGFLGPSAAAISVQGSNLGVPEGKSIVLVGGGVHVADATLRTIGGDIVIAGMGAAGEVSLAAAGVPIAPVMIERSTIETESGAGSAPGRIAIVGGEVRIVASNIASTNRGDTAAGAMNFGAPTDLTITASHVTSSTEGAGKGADITLAARNVVLNDDTQVISQTFGGGAGGNVEVRAEQRLDIVPSGFTSIYALGYGDGAAGRIDASADSILVETGNIGSVVSGNGHAGPIRLRARNIGVHTGGWVYSQTFADGNGADIDILASNRVEVSGLYFGDSSQLWTQSYGVGHGGNIRVEAPSIRFADGRAAATASLGSGRGGDIVLKGSSIVATDGTEVHAHAYSGPGGNVLIEANEFFLGRDSNVYSFTDGSANAGKVTVKAGSTTIMGGVLWVYNYGSGAGGDLSITGDKLYVGGTPGPLGDGSIVSYVGYEALGKGGKITIDVPSIVFGPYSKLWSVTNGVGHGGDVLIRTHNIEAKAGSVLFTDTAPWANGGNGGNFTLVGTGRLIMGTDPVPPFDHWILAGDVTSIGAFSAGPGRSGDVTINIPEIRGYNGSNFVAFGKNTGDAGNVTINTERMSLSGKSSVYVWAVNDFGGRHLNNAGNISINASESFEMSSDREAYRESRFDQTLFYRGGIRLQAMTDGNAGTMAITSPRIVLDDVTVEASNWFAGGGGRIEINTNDLTLRNGARIDTKAMPESSGNAGSIVVNARDRVDLSGMSLFDGSFSGISAQTWGGGAGGDVRIRTDELSIDRGYVKSSTGGAGRAGSVDIEARRVMLTSGATIDAGTTDISTGAGGSVRVSASEAITLSGIDRNAIVAIPEQPERTPIWADALGPGRAQGPSPSQISSNTAGAGAGGNVVVSAPQILIEDGARITANSTGTGTAGSIFLTATDWLKLNNGAITTQALASDGGNIDIRVNNMLRLNNSEISTSVGSGSGSGGNIFIDPTFVILESSRIAANAFGGAGGNINVIANVFLASPDSVIDASSQLGVPGSVQVSAPRTDAVSGLPALPVQFFDATGLLREACAGPAGATRSRLIGLGRGGVAETPFSYAASRYFEDTPMSAAEIVRPPALTSAALGESALLGQMCQL